MTSDTEFLDTTTLPDPAWQRFYDRIHVDEEWKERIVNHALLADRLAEQGIEGFTVSHHGLLLLYGPPGTGKTTLAKGAANEIARRRGAEVAFRHVRIDQLGSGGLGETPEAVADVFATVRADADRGVDQVLLLDEVESLLTERSELGGDTDPEDVRRAVNTALDELDLLADADDVFAIATSNAPDIVDAAFMSRVDEAVELGVPGPRHRAAILCDVFQAFNDAVDAGLPTTPVELGDLVQVTAGCSGRAIRKGVRNALLQDGVAADPAALTCDQVRAAFADDAGDAVEQRTITCGSREQATLLRDAVPDEVLAADDDRREKTVELAADASPGWVEFAAAAADADGPAAGDAAVPVVAGDGGSDAAPVVDELLPRTVVFNSTAAHAVDALLDKVADVVETTLDRAGYAFTEEVAAALADDQVVDIVFEFVQRQVLDAVVVAVAGLDVRVDVAYDRATAEFLEPPTRETVPALGDAAATVRLRVDGAARQAPATVTEVGDAVTVTCAPAPGEEV